MSIFSSRAIAQRKDRSAALLRPLLGERDALVVHAGHPIQKPGGHDQTYDFLPHPDYFWLTGSRREAGVSVFTLRDGWVDFVKPVSRDELVWEGGADVIPGKPIAELSGYLSKLGAARLFAIGQVGREDLAAAVDDETLAPLQEAFNQARRVKDEEEVALIERLAAMANAGYGVLRELIRPGLSERQLQIAYESAVFSAGAEKMPYGSIVGTGTNSAILHASPSSRIVQAGDIVLVDAGADVQDYCVDITRVFPANGKRTGQQELIYQLVLKAQLASIDLCHPGVDWHDVHKASARVFAQGLADLNIITTDPAEALEAGAVSVFFPHGVGHMVGLRVRDVGGRFTKTARTAFGVRVRVDMPLEEGFCMTVEPGLYFIQALLDDPQTREKFAGHINWQEIEKWRSFGGIRLEDDILVTKSGPRNLTAVVPK